MKPLIPLFLASVLSLAALEWEEKSADEAIKVYSHEQAAAYCAGLGDGWRLPESRELFALARSYAGKPNPLPEARRGNYWSATPFALSGDHAWQILLPQGDLLPLEKSKPLFVRCVKGTAEKPMAPEKRFEKTKTVVKDKATGLTWQVLDRRSRRAKFDFQEAAARCATLELEGLTWRIPTVEELFSIADHALADPAVPDVFKPVVPRYYWTGDILDGFTHEAYVVGFKTGTVAVSSRKNRSFVRCVSGGK